MIPRLGSFADHYSFGCSSHGLFLPVNSGGMQFEIVDSFWNEPFVSRAATRLDLEALMSVDNNPSPSCPRTVSGQARENSVDGLSLEESDELDSFESSPVSQSSSQGGSTTCSSPAVAPSTIKISRKRQRARSPIGSVDNSDTPRIHLGEYGRCKLKSLISAAIKEDCHLRTQVLSVSKIKLASIPQLLHMAQLCGLWDEAVLISEHFVKKSSI